MQLFRGATALEVIALRVDAGEDLLASLNRAVSDCQLAAGTVLAGSGTLGHMILEAPATVTWPPAAFAIEKTGPGQIVSAQGHVAGGEAELFVTVVKRNETYAGKVMPGTLVLHGVELSLLRVGNARWLRVPHPETGVPLFQAAVAAPAATAAQPILLMGRPIDPNALALVPPALLRKHGCLPVARSGDTLVVAMSDPSNPFAMEDLREATGLRIQTFHVPAQDLMPALHQALTVR